MNNSKLKLNLPVKVEVGYVCNGGTFFNNQNDLPAFECKSKIRLTKYLKKVLKKLIKFSASKDVRYYLNGIYFNLDCLVATDGHRLLKTKRGVIDNIYLIDKPFIMPINFIKQLFRFDVWDNETDLQISDDDAYIELHDGIFHEKLIDGKYPNYERLFSLIENNPDTELEITKPLAIAIRKEAALEKVDNRKFAKHGNITFINDKIQFPNSSIDNQSGITTTRKNLSITLNYHYFIDFPEGVLEANNDQGGSYLLSYQSFDGIFEGLLMSIRPPKN